MGKKYLFHIKCDTKVPMNGHQLVHTFDTFAQIHRNSNVSNGFESSSEGMKSA